MNADRRLELAKLALAGMAGRDREVLSRFYLQEQTGQRICHDMGLSEAEFRLIKSRARAVLESLPNTSPPSPPE